jgi:hypothetical protein
MPGGIQRDELKRSMCSEVTNGQTCDFSTCFCLNWYPLEASASLAIILQLAGLSL